MSHCTTREARVCFSSPAPVFHQPSRLSPYAESGKHTESHALVFSESYSSFQRRKNKFIICSIYCLFQFRPVCRTEWNFILAVRLCAGEDKRPERGICTDKERQDAPCCCRSKVKKSLLGFHLETKLYFLNVQNNVKEN